MIVISSSQFPSWIPRLLQKLLLKYKLLLVNHSSGFKIGLERRLINEYQQKTGEVRTVISGEMQLFFIAGFVKLILAHRPHVS